MRHIILDEFIDYVPEGNNRHSAGAGRGGIGDGGGRRAEEEPKVLEESAARQRQEQRKRRLFPMGQGRRRRPPGQHGLQAPRRTDDGEQVQIFDAFLSLTHHLIEQYQGGAGGSNSEEEDNEKGVPSGPNCMKKLMLVNEIVYEEKVKVSE